MSDLGDASSGVAITLTGRCSTWLWRVPAGAADRGIRPPARGTPSLLSSWLHHPAYGMLGVYLTPSLADAVPSDPRLQACLARNRRIHGIGILRPYLAGALADDPRATGEPLLTPLVIELTAITMLTSTQAQTTAPVIVHGERSDRIVGLAGRPLTELIPLAHWPDAVYWHTSGPPPTAIATWNRIRGVTTVLGPHRYIRYVLWHDPRHPAHRPVPTGLPPPAPPAEAS